MGWTRQEVLDVARSTGRPVVEAWSDHNAGSMGTVLGPMLHHTGSAWSYPRLTAPTLRVVRDGRAGLENALSMYYIDYEGVIYCITEKLAWHAGAGSWQGITDGNGHYAGIEAESDGVQWTKPTVASYKKLATGILRKTGRTVAHAPRHADFALPRGRKSDFSGIDPATFLADVNSELAGNPTTEDVMNAAQEAKLDRVLAALSEGGGSTGRNNFAWLADQVTPTLDDIRAALIGGNQQGMNNFHWLAGQILTAIAANGPVEVTAEAIAAAIPSDIAEQVAQRLADRLSS